MRSGGQCKIISKELGWTNHLSLSLCDKCLAMGPRSEEATKYRVSLCQSAVRDLIKFGLPKCPLKIQEMMCKRHLPLDEAEAYLIRHALKFGMTKALEIADEIERRRNESQG